MFLILKRTTHTTTKNSRFFRVLVPIYLKQGNYNDATNKRKYTTISLNNFSNQINYHDEVSVSNEVKLPSSCKVVICGGGLIGTSVAYHLAELGLEMFLHCCMIACQEHLNHLKIYVITPIKAYLLFLLIFL